MRSILITGASGGLGKTVVQHFAEMGFHVIATYHASPPDFNLKNVKEFQWDVSQFSSTNQLSEYLGETGLLHGWIHLIGGFWGGFNFEDTTPDKIDQMMTINFKSAYMLTPIVTGLFREEFHSSIVFIGGEAGLKPSPGFGAYGVSKASLMVYMQTLAEEMKGRRVSVNMVVPSTIDTPANRKAMPNADFSKWITPVEISHTLAWLFSDKAEKVNGSVIRLNG